MTPEAALTKLAYVLSKENWDKETKRQMMRTNLRGELTAEQLSSLQDLDLVGVVGRSLGISSFAQFQELGSILFPAIINAAVLARDLAKLESLKVYVNFWHLLYIFIIRKHYGSFQLLCVSVSGIARFADERGWSYSVAHCLLRRKCGNCTVSVENGCERSR